MSAVNEFNRAFSHFENGDWGEAWVIVKNDSVTDESLGSLHQKTLIYALRTALIAGWWRLDEQAKEMLSQLPYNEATDPYLLFLITYSQLCLGENPSSSLLRKLESSSKKYLYHWIKIEYLGRSASYSKQLVYISNLTKFERLSTWIRVALIRSLDHPQVAKSHLRNIIDSLRYPSEKPKLDDSLRYMIDLNDSKLDCPESLLARASFDMAKGELSSALRGYDRLAKIKYLDVSIIFQWLNLSVSFSKGHFSLQNRIDYVLDFIPDDLHLRASVSSYGLIYYWISGEPQKAHSILQTCYQAMYVESDQNYKSALSFLVFVTRLYSLKQHNQSLYPTLRPAKSIVVIGESHSLSLSHLNIKIRDNGYRCTSAIVIGTQMNHLANPDSSHRAACVEAHIKENHACDAYLFTIGEIDCRPDEGIWKTSQNKKADIKNLINKTVEGYLCFIRSMIPRSSHQLIVVQGIPAPNYMHLFELGNDLDKFLNMIEEVNRHLQEKCKIHNFKFLDVYSATVDASRKSNDKFHIDKYHLSPLFYSLTDQFLID
jgi:hypothetical protein